MDPDLIQRLRDAPFDPALRAVVGDLLQASGDPRGARIAQHLAGRLSIKQAERSVRVSGVQPVSFRMRQGLVTDIEPSSGLTAEWLTEEPLAIVKLSLPWQEKEHAAFMQQWDPILRQAYGLCLAGTTTEEVQRWIATLGLHHLELHSEVTVPLPGVRSAYLHRQETLPDLPDLTHLRLLSPAALRAALTLPALTHVDLRTVTLDEAHQERLRAWHGTVLHPQFELDPPPVFSWSGLRYADDPETTVRCTAGRDGDYAQARQMQAYFHDNDAPVDQHPLDAEVPEMVAFRARLVAPRPEFPHALPEPILATAASEDTAWAISGGLVWRFHDGTLSVIGSCQDLRPRLDADGDTVVWTHSPTMAIVEHRGIQRTVAYGGGYLGSAGASVFIGDVAAIDGGAALVALEKGGANLLLPTGALKLDEHPGQQVLRWTFVYNGQILVAG